MPEKPIIALTSISKKFDGVQALDDITLDIYPGTVHALVGENGAGKSTLGKIVAGIYYPDRGQIKVDGVNFSFNSPRDALAMGIAMISQEVALVPKSSVIDNVFLGIESIRYRLVQEKTLQERYKKLTEETGIFIPPDIKVESLRIADQKKVEVLRAVAQEARLIVMDEPTASLSSVEAETLYALINGLRDIGTTIIYVSHFLEEVILLANTVTVLRNGKLIKTSSVHEETPESLVSAMLGGYVSVGFPEKQCPETESPVVLSVEKLSHGNIYKNISFEIRAGEIVGLAGLAGSGRTEICRGIFGADKITSGTIKINNEIVNVQSPFHAVKAGIALLPESRKLEGLIMKFSKGHNITLPHLAHIANGPIIKTKKEQEMSQSLMTDLDVRPADPKGSVGSLSGGNQQKVLFAKWLFREPKVFIADEPTAGVDVGAKRAIYQLIHKLASEGMAVLLVSSDLSEILGLAHRVLAIRKGEIVMECLQCDITEDTVMHAIFATEKDGAN